MHQVHYYDKDLLLDCYDSKSKDLFSTSFSLPPGLGPCLRGRRGESNEKFLKFERIEVRFSGNLVCCTLIISTQVHSAMKFLSFHNFGHFHIGPRVSL